MKVSEVTGELVMRWVPVADERGRTYLEAVWVTVGEPQHIDRAA